ncbi:MAG: pyrroline-5-carboxylate reductase [Bacillota bacterium]|nr:pyrroline-5-carboxylate reductase [Bacillota bacterium]
MKKFGFFGAGNMATAIIDGMIRSNFTEPESIFVYDIDTEKLSVMQQKGINTCKNSGDVAKNAEIIVLAVKPQNYKELLNEIKNDISEQTVLVSIAAGISIDFIVKNVEKNVPVVRVMPNTPLLLGKGSTAMAKSENISDEDFKIVYDLFALSGTVEILTEDLMNAVISVNGSSPAYIYLFAKAMADYAVEQGINYDSAMNLICATFEGSAAMLKHSGDTPDVLIKKVSSPGGTTLKALETLDSLHFYDAVKNAMDACTKRAIELCSND